MENRELRVESGVNITKKLHAVFALLSLLAVVLTASFLTILFTSSKLAKAETTDSTSSDFTVTVDEVIAINISSPCDSPSYIGHDVTLDISPRSNGVMSSCPNVVTVDTNTAGFQLLFKASSSNLVHTTNSSLVIPSTSNTVPGTLASNTWGYGIPATSSTDHSITGIPSEITSVFDNTYLSRTNQNPIPNDKYATTPTADALIKQIEDNPTTITGDKTSIYYGATADMATSAGTYKTTITYTAIGQEVPPPYPSCGTPDDECIIFTVDIGATNNYSIPTSGSVAGIGHTYDWDVYIDGVLTSSCTDGNCAGTGYGTSAGITLTGLSAGIHQIKILPHGNNSESVDNSIPGWGNAFGYGNNSSGANTLVNKGKIISIDRPLTTMAFAPKTTESTTNASNMFANVFNGCYNLANTVSFINTYKLPDTITNLSYFFSRINVGNTNLTKPINLIPLTSMFDSNTSITNLSYFLHGVHESNTSLTTPIDLTPLADWFSANTSITNLSYFLYIAYYNNTNLTAPIDLTPLSGWFSTNRSMTTLTNFMYQTHYNNTSLVLTGQTILPNWIKTMTNGSGTPLYNTGTSTAYYSLYHTFYRASSSSNDTAEIKFVDGTVLSSMGAPSANRQTYTNRSGITPANSNWK